MAWLEQILAPIYFSTCSGVTITLYITVRPSGLPFYVYVWVPLVGIIAFGLISWFVYDVVMVKRAAEHVLGTLQSRSAPFYGRLSADQRRELRQRTRALRPVHLSFGNFSDMSLEVLANIWDEMLNQLLFLLSV